MATLDTIRTVTVRGQSQDLDKVAGDLKAVAGAQRDVAASGQAMASVTDASSRRTLSVTAALQRLASAHDDSYRAEQQHAKATQVLERAAAQGLSGTKEYAVAQAALAKMHREAGEAAGFNRSQIMEATHVAKSFFDEIMAGQSPMRAIQVEGGRIAQIFTEGQGGVGGTFKALAGLLGRAATGWVGLAVATTVAAATIGGSVLAYEAGQERMQRALEGTGRAAGMTVAQLQAVAEAGARASGISGGEGRTLAMGFARHGFDADLTQSLVGASRRYGDITGQGTAEAGAKLGEIFEDPLRGLGELDKTFGLLDARLQDTVEHLAAQGDVDAARQVALEAYLKAQGEVTDQTWGLSKAFADAEHAVSDWAGRVSHTIAASLGLSTDGDKLATDRTTLANLEKVDPVGNTDYIAELRAEIADLEKKEAAASGKATEDRSAALARELSLKVEGAVHAALPDMERERNLTDRLALLGRGMNTPGVAGDLGASAGQLSQAFGRTAVLSTFTDPNRRMADDHQLARASAEAFTLAEHAAVDARRAELAVLRDTGDISRAAVAAETARNEAIAKANQDARDSLAMARQSAGLVGLSPFERSQQEIRDRFEGYGGLIEKASAGRSELDAAMRPVADDLHAAGESIARAMRDAAATVAAGVTAKPAEGVGPFFPAPYGGKAGAVSDHERQLVDMLVKAGFTNRDADAGFVGGVSGESGMGLDPGAHNASGHRGIAQWDASRFAGVSAFGGQGDFLAQAQLLVHELQTSEGAAGAALRDATTVQGGLAANLRFERPSRDEIASSYNKRLAAGIAVAGDHGAPPAAMTELPPLTIHASRLGDGGMPGGPAPVAPIAATAAGTYRTQEGVELGADVKARIVGPLQEANTALNARIALLGTENATLGQNAAAQQAAAEARKLLSQYEAQDPNHAMGAEAWRRITDGVDLYRQKLQGAMEAEQEFGAHQRDLVGAMDDVRDAAKGALSSFVGDVMHGKTALEGLHDALSSIETKLAGKVEDTAVDMLLGKPGGSGGGVFGSGLSGFFGMGAGSGAAAMSTASSFFPAFAGGGWVSGPGTGTSDSIPARLSNGEFVVHAKAAADHPDLLHAINAGRVPGFAGGGFVGGAPPGASGGGWGAGAGDGGGGGDVHIHNHFPGGVGDAHIETIARRGTASALATYDAKLPGRLAERKRRT